MLYFPNHRHTLKTMVKPTTGQGMTKSRCSPVDARPVLGQLYDCLSLLTFVRDVTAELRRDRVQASGECRVSGMPR